MGCVHPLGPYCPLPPQQTELLWTESLSAVVVTVKQLNSMAEQQLRSVSLGLALTLPPALTALFPSP